MIENNSQKRYGIRKTREMNIASDVIMPLILDTREEQRAMFDALRQRLEETTRIEITGITTEEFRNTNRIWREMLKGIYDNLGSEVKLLPQNWMKIGIIEEIPEELVQKWKRYPQFLLGSYATYFSRKEEQESRK